MKYLTVCLGALLAVALTVSANPTPASAGGYKSGPGFRAPPAFKPPPPVRRGGHKAYRSDCHKCPKARPNYDSTEVIKDTKEVDHSRVIETQSVVPSRRVIETNHLIVHENETRNVGTVEHNHTVIEKELVLTKRNVDHKYVNTEVNLVEHKYNTERKRVVEERELPGKVRHLRCDCPDDRKAAPLRSYGMAPKYVRSRY